VGALQMVEELFNMLLPFFDAVPPIRWIIGFILVFFLPGFAWTLVFFSRDRINYLERTVLSVGLSIALVTLSIIALNVLFNVSINTVNAILIILTITIIPLLWYYLRRFTGRRGNETPEN
jgi:uncharacterized membrane protein